MSYVVAFVSTKGGSGKSRLAQAFAVEAARDKVNVVIGDMDRGVHSATLWNEIRLQKGWKPSLVVKEIDRLSSTAIAGFDLTVFDTAGFGDKLTRELAEHASLVVVPMGADITGDVIPAHLLLSELFEAGVDKAKLAPVICKALSPALVYSAREYLDKGGYPALKHETYLLPSYVHAFNVGKAMTETDHDGPRDAAKLQIREIVKALGRVKELELAPVNNRERARSGRGA